LIHALRLAIRLRMVCGAHLQLDISELEQFLS